MMLVALSSTECACESERVVWEEADVPMIALLLAPRWVCR